MGDDDAAEPGSLGVMHKTPHRLPGFPYRHAVEIKGGLLRIAAQAEFSVHPGLHPVSLEGDFIEGVDGGTSPGEGIAVLPCIRRGLPPRQLGQRGGLGTLRSDPQVALRQGRYAIHLGEEEGVI